MRILFLVHNLSKTRHFEGVIRDLTERGHIVMLGAARKRKPLKAPKGLNDIKKVEVLAAPTQRTDGWHQAALALRRARDFARFLDPRYARADKLSARAAEYAPGGLERLVTERPWLRRHWRLLSRALAAAERLIPSERYFELFIKAERADLVLVTPLVDFGSYQTDYIKAAHRIGVPVAFLPFSWDNLTNRGLVRVTPDRVIVWNDIQKREAVEMHGVPADRIVVTGAPRFDDFFTMTAATTRDEFCRTAGLDPSRPFVLYTCSSNFVAPREADFVRRWVEALRAAADETVRHCNVLVRPHPAHPEEWEHVDFSDLPGVAIWSPKVEIQADQGLFDSLTHCAAVAGLNTSAMIEAAIIGRPVFTVAAADFTGGQQGTLHFWYLLTENGGIVTMARDFDEHVQQLRATLHGETQFEEQCRRFVTTFVRPRGIDKPVAHLMAREVERVGRMHKQSRGTAPWLYPFRWALLAATRARA